jgi:Na+/melibiose symporter-like transporter
MPSKRLNLSGLLTINVFWMGLSFKWNSLHVIILPAVLLHYAPDHLKNTYLGLLTFVGLVVAMLLQPLAGAMSDRWISAWGRRRPFILVGTLFDLLFLVAWGGGGGLVWLGLGYLALQISSNVAHGPAQGLIPDLVPADQLGVASGVKNLMDMGGLVIASLAMGNLVDPQASQARLPLLVVAVVVAVCTVITLIFVKESPSLSSKKDNPVKPEVTIKEIKQDLQSIQPAYWWLIASRFVFLLGIYDIQIFAQYYVRDVLQVENPVQLTGNLLAAITLALIASALGGGWLGDRFGYRKVLYVAAGVSALGCLLLVMARTPILLLVFGGILGVGIGLFLTSNWALASSLAPKDQAGKYLGLTNLATAGAGATGRLGGPLIDLLNNAAPGLFLGYMGMFVFGVVCSLASAGVLRRVK